MRDTYVPAILYVNTIIIPIGIAVDHYAVDNNIAALVIGLYPTGGIQQCHISNGYMLTTLELDELRTHKVGRPSILKIITRAIKFTGIKQAVDMKGEATPLSVNLSFACNSDIGLSVGQYQRYPAIQFPVIFRVYASQQHGFFCYMQFNI